MHVEGDGVVKLREYLMQTRRQAEMAIDSLNERIAELEKDNIEISDANKALADERDYFRNLAEQRKTENSKKWRLQERDDWKALVESVQKDRSRLQDDLVKREIELESIRSELAYYKRTGGGAGSCVATADAAAVGVRGGEEETSGVYFSIPNPSGNSNGLNISIPGGSAGDGVSLGSVSSEGSGTGTGTDDSTMPPMTPRALSRTLKTELEKAQGALEVERAAAEAERLSHVKEIGRLRYENRTLKDPTATVSSAISSVGMGSGGLLNRLPLVSGVLQLLTPYSNSQQVQFRARTAIQHV